MQTGHQYLLELLDRLNNFFLITVEIEGNYTYVNRAFSEKFGYITSDFIGKSCMQDVHPDDAAEVYKVVAQCMAEPGVFYTIIIRKPIGEASYITTSWDFIALNNEQGAFECVMCIGYELTMLLHEIEAKKAAITTLKAIQSHEVRRPVANILGLVDIFNKESLSDEHLYYLTAIKQCAMELDIILRELAGRKFE
jgi:PAS domain S-box-containing protein